MQIDDKDIDRSLDAAAGILLALLISVAIWTGVGVIVWAIYF